MNAKGQENKESVVRHNHLSSQLIGRIWLFWAGLVFLIFICSPSLTLAGLSGWLMLLLSLCLSVLGLVFLNLS